MSALWRCEPLSQAARLAKVCYEIVACYCCHSRGNTRSLMIPGILFRLKKAGVDPIQRRTCSSTSLPSTHVTRLSFCLCGCFLASRTITSLQQFCSPTCIELPWRRIREESLRPKSQKNRVAIAQGLWNSAYAKRVPSACMEWGRFQVTLYYEQWVRLLDSADKLREFLEETKASSS
jgi:hypothetical protein